MNGELAKIVEGRDGRAYLEIAGNTITRAHEPGEFASGVTHTRTALVALADEINAAIEAYADARFDELSPKIGW